MFVMHKHRALTAARWFAHRKGCPEAKAQLRLLFIVVSRDPNLSQRSPAGRVEQKPGPVAAYRPPVLRGLFLARLIDLFVTQAIKNEKKRKINKKQNQKCTQEMLCHKNQYFEAETPSQVFFISILYFSRFCDRRPSILSLFCRMLHCLSSSQIPSPPEGHMPG